MKRKLKCGYEHKSVVHYDSRQLLYCQDDKNYP